MKTPYLLPKFSELQKQYDSVVQCNRCGFCETVCPTYMVSGKETLSPRGRNQALRQILEGKIKNPKLASEIFTTCLTCHACTNVCFSEVPVAKLMAHARSIVQQEHLPNLAEQFIFRYLLLHRALFSIFLWIGFFLKRIGISVFLKKLKLLKKISPELDAAEELVEKVPLHFGIKNKRLHQAKDAGRVAYFSGCGIHYLFPQVSLSANQLFQKMGYDVSFPPHSCCGLPAQSAGDFKNAKRLAKKNIDDFLKLGVATIIVDDDSCAGFMKNYVELLDGDLKAVAFSKKIKNLSEFLVESNPSIFSRSEELFERGVREAENLKRSDSLSSAPTLGERPRSKMFRATYHDPCQMGNGHHMTDAPRKILKSLKNINFVEMEESNWCCGGAGTYCLKHPHLAEDVLERKLFNIERSGAECVVTQASSCLLHIGYGIRKKGWQDKIKIMHLAEFLKEGEKIKRLRG